MSSLGNEDRGNRQTQLPKPQERSRARQHANPGSNERGTCKNLCSVEWAEQTPVPNEVIKSIKNNVAASACFVHISGKGRDSCQTPALPPRLPRIMPPWFLPQMTSSEFTPPRTIWCEASCTVPKRLTSFAVSRVVSVLVVVVLCTPHI
jgi:hypothetical protein